MNISTNNLNLSNGGQISAESRGESDAGNVNVKVFNNLNLEGLNSGIFSRTGNTGDSGKVNIDAAKT